MLEKCKWTDANVDVHILCFVCCSTLHLSLNHEVSNVLHSFVLQVSLCLANSVINVGMDI